MIVLKTLLKSWNHVKTFNLKADTNLQIISYFATCYIVGLLHVALVSRCLS
jgi:MFS superfamily sulfate permease-like transporter